MKNHYAGMDRRSFQFREIRSGKSDESDTEVVAGLEEDVGVVIRPIETTLPALPRLPFEVVRKINIHPTEDVVQVHSTVVVDVLRIDIKLRSPVVHSPTSLFEGLSVAAVEPVTFLPISFLEN
jgi:hypothetical protein